MPSNWLYIDTNFPTFTGEESPNDKINTIQNYLYMLVEQLRYSLHNLDPSKNMNMAAMEQFTGELTSPIYLQIGSLGEGVNARMEEITKDLSGKIALNTSSIEQTAQAITSQVSSLEVELSGKISANTSMIEQTATSITHRVESAEYGINGLTGDLELVRHDVSTLEQTATSITATVKNIQGDVSTLQQTATSLTAEIKDAKGNISKLQQTATSLSTEIKDAQKGVSTLQQTVDGFTLEVSNKTGKSTISLKSGGATIATSGDITLGGDVIFKSNLTDGTTKISGANIMTGKIKADYIDVDSIKLKYLYNSDGKLAIDASAKDSVTIGGNWSSRDVTHVVIKGTSVTLGTETGLTIKGDEIYPASAISSSLGTSSKYWGYLYVNTIYGKGGFSIHGRPTMVDGALFGDTVTMNERLVVSGTSELDGNVRLGGSGKTVGFFGSLGAKKQTVARTATVETLITALQQYGLI